MQIVLINPSPKGCEDLCPNLSILHLASFLSKNHYSVIIKDLPIPFHENLDNFGNALNNTDVIGITATSINWSYINKFIKYIKKSGFDGKIVLGGVHPSHFPEHVLKTSLADYVIRDEGERPFLNLLHNLKNNKSMNEILGLSFKEKNGEIKHNPDSKKLTAKEMDELPLPSYDFLMDQKKKYKFLPYETSRGCKFHCTFCSIRFNRSWRGKSVDTVVKQLLYIYNNYYSNIITDAIFIVDSCFTGDINRAKNITNKLIKAKFYAPLYIDVRVTDLLDEELLKNLSMLNVKHIQVGVETGYDEGQKKIRKGYPISTIYECGKLVTKYNLNYKMNWSFIIGFPWEREKEIISTVKTGAIISNEFGGIVNLNWLALYPSDIWNHKEKFNIKIDEKIFDKLENENDMIKFLKKPLFIEDKFIKEVYKMIHQYRSMGYSINLLPEFLSKSGI